MAKHGKNQDSKGLKAAAGKRLKGALYCGYTPETWAQMCALRENSHEETLTENAEAVLQLEGLLAALRDNPPAAGTAQHQAWLGLCRALGYDAGQGRPITPNLADLPAWLPQLYAPATHSYGLVEPEQLAVLADALESSGLPEALSDSAGLRMQLLFRFVQACARQGRVLLAIEPMA